MELLRTLYRGLAHDRRWWRALLVILLIGSLYGFWWYRAQLLAAPLWQWPIIPDSPGSSFLLFIWVGFLVVGADWRHPGMQWLGAFAFVSNMKYGLWSAVVLPRAGMLWGWEFDYVHLSLSHAGMWLQAIIFARHFRPALAPAIGALLYMWFQDLIDYRILMTYPTLPNEALLPFAAAAAVVLSTLWGGFLVLQAWFDRKPQRS